MLHKKIKRAGYHLKNKIHKFLKVLKKRKDPLWKIELVASIVLIVLLIGMVAYNFPFPPLSSPTKIQRVEQPKETTDATLETEDNIDLQTVEKEIDTSTWKPYLNNVYGFSVKHPRDWKVQVIKPQRGATYATKYVLTKAAEPGMELTSEDEILKGVAITVYDSKKITGIVNTDEIKLRDGVDLQNTDCQVMQTEVHEEGARPAVHVMVPNDDQCFSPAYFYSISRDRYFFQLTPLMDQEGEIDLAASETQALLKEFDAVFAQFKITQIIRSTPKASVAQAKPRSSAPMPISAKRVGGKLVCAKKNDKPSKSKKNPKGHMDMQCCLDPGEKPNPHCTY